MVGSGIMMKTGVKRTCTDMQLSVETKRNKSDFRDWAALPEGLLHMILQHLDLQDCSSFMKVCESWQTFYKHELFLTRQEAGIPLLMMGGQTRSTTRIGYSIMEDVCYRFEFPEFSGSCIWGSVQDWLVLLKKHDDNFEICLLNPFSRAKLPLPKISTSRDMDGLVLSSSPCDENCVFVLLGFPIAFWISGAPRWHESFLYGHGPFVDGVFCQGCFYLLSLEDSVAVINAQKVVSAMTEKDTTTEISVTHLGMKSFLSNRDTTKYLVESCNDLLLVCQYFEEPEPGFLCGTRYIDVYRLDARETAWVKLKSLGDRVLFIGNNCSSVKKLGFGMPNCVYFTYSGNVVPFPWNRRYDYENYSEIDHWGVWSLSERDAKNFASHTNPDMLGATWLTTPTCCYNNSSSSS